MYPQKLVLSDSLQFPILGKEESLECTAMMSRKKFKDANAEAWIFHCRVRSVGCKCCWNNNGRMPNVLKTEYMFTRA